MKLLFDQNLSLRLGNCTTAQIEALLRLHYDAIRQLTESDNIGVLSLL